MPKTKISVKARKTTIKPVKKTGLTTEVFNTDGKPVGKTDLPKEIFGVEVNDKLLAQAVRVYLANQRQGTVDTKTRGEVAGSTRKVYRQKGTGRARHGSIKAPIYVGGGIAFGPHPRDFNLKMPQKMKQKALFSALTNQFLNHNLLVIDNPQETKLKTASMVKLFDNLKIGVKHGHLTNHVLLVNDPLQSQLILACRNLQNLTLSRVSLLNSYLILANQKIIFTKEAMKTLETLWKKPKS